MANFLFRLKNYRLLSAFTYDICISLITFWIAIYLRFDSFNPPSYGYDQIKGHFALSIMCLVMSYLLNGLYMGLWRFSSLYDLVRVVRACAAGIFSALVINFFFSISIPLPRSVYLIHFLLLVMCLGGGRFVYRLWKDFLILRRPSNGLSKRVLIIGAGIAGARIVREIQMDKNLGLKVIGFIDDDPFKRGKLLHETKVLGNSKKMTEIIAEYKIDKVFVAIPSANSSQLKKIMDSCEGLDIELKVLPKIDQLLASQSGLSLLRNVKIEDLLGREQVALDMNALKSMISNKVILVSGAGGSIGRELCFQIAKFLPKEIIFYDCSEYFLYELENIFKEQFPYVKYAAVIGDIRNIDKLNRTFDAYKPQFVFHAAAYKHVPMMEINAEEAIDTNIRGTKNIAEVSIKHNVEKFVLISTDKAVNPTNIMGATKRIAEMTILNLFEKYNRTKFIAVRFGNVLGSNGSVIPLFKKQIEDRQDLTITHPDITRYFMSIPEASQLVLQAGVMGNGGEVFVLDMGEPVKITDLARTMIKLSGLKIDQDISIKFVGLRAGEKMHEELFGTGENIEKTDHEKINKAKTRKNDVAFDTSLENLIRLVPGSTHASILKMIKCMMPEFTHQRLEEDSKESLKEVEALLKSNNLN